MKAAVDNLQKREKLNSPNIIKILNYTINRQQLLINLYFEDQRQNLEEDPFILETQDQKYFLIDNILRALTLLYQNSMIHGCVNRKSIFYNKNTYQFMLVDNFGDLWRNSETPSPDMLSTFVSNPFLEDVFSLGMTMLSFESKTNFYQGKKFKRTLF